MTRRISQYHGEDHTPPISQPIGAILFSLITLAYGILVEKYFVEKRSVIFNALNTIVLAMTTDFFLFGIEYLGFIPLIAYVFIGWRLVRVEGHNWAKHPFGCKVYGSLSLALAINDFNGSSWFMPFLNMLGFFIHSDNPLYSSLDFFQSNIVLFSFLAILIVVIILQIVVLKKDIKLRI